jgi:hypothetical protein
MNEEQLIILVRRRECWYNLQHENFDNDLVKERCWKDIVQEIHAKCKKQSAQYFFNMHKLTDVMRLCDTTTKIMQLLRLLQLKNANEHGQGSALATDNDYVRVGPETAKHPNGVSMSIYSFFQNRVQERK